MKTIRAVLFLLALAASAVLEAGSFTITYTAAQDTVIQTRIIPAANTAKCAAFRLGAGCSSAQLVTNGCVAVALPSKNYNACTIYTADAAGEVIFLQDESNRTLVDRFNQLNNSDNVAFITPCQASSAAAKANACAAVGAPATCNPCQ